jgi:ribonuclease BN (tRNA processing enzyme)
MTMFQLVVLGSSASAPAPGDACSGYLVRHAATRLLLDCGGGTLSRLLVEGESLTNLSAIVISHFHPDHYLDLVTMRYALRYAVSGVGPRPCLLVPPGGREFLGSLGGALRKNPRFFEDAFDLSEYDPASGCQIDELELAFCRTTHDEPTWAVGVTAPDRRRLVYSGDTRACAELEIFARGAELFLCEATYPSAADALPSDNHLTSAEAGDMARRAGARQLMLTHFWPTFARDAFARAGSAAFGAPVCLAAPGAKVALHA